MKKNIFYMISAFVAIVIIAMLIVTELMEKSDFVSSASFEDVSSVILQTADIDNMVLGDNQMIRRLYGIDPDDFEEVLLYYPKTNMNAEEMILIKLKDIEQTDTVVAMVEARRDTQLKSFEGYGADQTAMLENSIIESRGGYVLFISSDDPETVKRTFDKAL